MINFTGPTRVLCAHADQDGAGAHWRWANEPCPSAEEQQRAAPEAGP